MDEPTDFHPDLRFARYLPRTVVGSRSVGLIRKLTARSGSRPPSEGVLERVDANVTVRLFRPDGARPKAPAVLFVHGGGYLIGNAAMGDGFCRRVAGELGAVAASVEYRLAPEHPFPVPLEDCYAALRWLAARSDVDARRIALVGESAGGGLAAALAHLCTWSAEVSPVLQVLSYPMLDDRTTARTYPTPGRLRLWNERSNRLGWRSYLGSASGDTVSPLAVPARCDDMTGLAPAWIGVGTNDLFYAEDLAYAERLRQAGIRCTLRVVPGAYHGFDLVERRTPVARAFRRARLDALDDALNGGADPT
ncbi:alpha/beta hydrolase [Nocardia sp. NPDC056541]|uniref:alpha/beta hydrolase n=1 Tax=Nocardia sp. NPDC056541 TaxID=3345860 RepID=UPI00366CC2D2